MPLMVSDLIDYLQRVLVEYGDLPLYLNDDGNTVSASSCPVLRDEAGVPWCVEVRCWSDAEVEALTVVKPRLSRGA